MEVSKLDKPDWFNKYCIETPQGIERKVEFTDEWNKIKEYVLKTEKESEQLESNIDILFPTMTDEQKFMLFLISGFAFNRGRLVGKNDRTNDGNKDKEVRDN